MPNYAPEKGKGHLHVMDAEAEAAMTRTGADSLKTAQKSVCRAEAMQMGYACRGVTI